MSKWINFNKSFGLFQTIELNKSGTLIETKQGIFLIGDINELGGVCDDCVAFSTDEIILRYQKIILDK